MWQILLTLIRAVLVIGQHFQLIFKLLAVSFCITATEAAQGTPYTKSWIKLWSKSLALSNLHNLLITIFQESHPWSSRFYCTKKTTKHKTSLLYFAVHHWCNQQPMQQSAQQFNKNQNSPACLPAPLWLGHWLAGSLRSQRVQHLAGGKTSGSHRLLGCPQSSTHGLKGRYRKILLTGHQCLINIDGVTECIDKNNKFWRCHKRKWATLFGSWHNLYRVY